MPPPVGLVDNGDGKPSVHDTGTGGPPKVVPSLANGWSHHWRRDGPIPLAKLTPDGPISLAGDGLVTQTTSADGTLHFALSWTGGFPAEPAVQMTEREFELPAARWGVTLSAGSNLVPTCSDVIDPSAPTLRVNFDTPVVGGHVVLVELPDEIQGPAVAEMTDLVIERPDGTTESIGRSRSGQAVWGSIPVSGSPRPGGARR